MSEVERRRHPRVSTDLPLQLTFRDATVETRIRDLSNSGIRFRAPAPFPVLSRVQIALELPDPNDSTVSSLAITGVVVRCAEIEPGDPAPFDTAIYFEDLSERARGQLARFVDARLR